MQHRHCSLHHRLNAEPFEAAAYGHLVWTFPKSGTPVMLLRKSPENAGQSFEAFSRLDAVWRLAPHRVRDRPRSPDKADEAMVPGGGFEPPTRGFSIRCSTN